MPEPERSLTLGDWQRARMGRGLLRHLDGAILKVCAAALRSAPLGHLHLTLPSGRSAMLGLGSSRGSEARLTVATYSVIWNALRRGPIGFAESFRDGDIATDNLHDVFNYYFDNRAALMSARHGLFRVGWRDRLLHRRRANTKIGSRRNIAAHYDLGNAFYRQWLDAGLTYSSAIYREPEQSLEVAQAEKIRCILEALEVRTGMSLLEIGCGWGSFAEAAANLGAQVTGITISEQQHQEASDRLRRAGLVDHAEIRFEDYRDVEGQFDRIASIEMIEAVGEANWATYFGVLADRLKPGGCGVIQAITIADAQFEAYRRKPDFIQRFIFPGGMLPTVAAMRSNAEAAGLTFETVETFGTSYALTLAEWRRRFDAAWPRIAALGFDDRFRRLWQYYLAYCEVGFARGAVDVGLYRVRKPL